MSRRFHGLTAIHVLLVVALAEVAIQRVLVPLTEPTDSFERDLLVQLGSFLFYFVGVLAAVVLASRCVPTLANRETGLRHRIVAGTIGVATIALVAPLVIALPGWAYVVELAFAIAVIVAYSGAIGRDRDLGVLVGLPIMFAPLLFHVIGFAVWQFGYGDIDSDVFHMTDAPGERLDDIAVVLMAIAALTSPYCFAPRPFARAVTRPLPIVIAMVVAALGAVAARAIYPKLAEIADRAFHIKLDPIAPDPKLALLLLAFATLTWTLAACALSPHRSRRTVGYGIALITLAGAEFHYPHHFLLPVLGVLTIADAAAPVYDEERAAQPVVITAPPIADSAWTNFVGAVAAGLRRKLADVHSLTTRADSGIQSSLFVGTFNGVTVRTRIERLEGSVVALDVVAGREIDELRGATVTLWAIPDRAARVRGVNPPAPPAAPPFRTTDTAFDAKFRCRGNIAVFARWFDDATRARATATLDGWLAYWDHEGMRYRVYPGRGAPLDHPLPLSDLALGRPSSPERLLVVVELLADLAARVLESPAPASEPQELSE